MSNEYFESVPDNQVKTVKSDSVENDEWWVNKIITEEYQVGWIVQQIIYIERNHEIMILFKRKD